MKLETLIMDIDNMVYNAADGELIDNDEYNNLVSSAAEFKKTYVGMMESLSLDYNFTEDDLELLNKIKQEDDESATS
jgi:hypothetical protein